MLDKKQIHKLDREFRRQTIHGAHVRPGNTEDMEGVLTEKLVTPSGAYVLRFSDGTGTASVFVSEPIYRLYSVGQRCKVTYNRHSLIGLAHASDPAFENDDRRFEQQTITVTVRTRGETCELSDEQIGEWYRDRIERLLDPNIGEHEVSVSVQRERLSMDRSE